MHVNRGMLGWGVFFIALGAVPLSVRSGALDAGTASRAWELWPLLLIGAGLGLALRGTSAASLGNIIGGLTLGLMAGGLVVGGIGSAPVAFCGTGTTGVTDGGTTRTGTIADGAGVDLEVDCGSLTASSQPGADWSLTWPKGASTPQFDTNADRHVGITMGSRHGFAVGDQNARWSLALPADATMDLTLAVNAGSARLALGDARVSSMSTSVNAGDAHVDLGAVSGMQTVDGSVNAGSLSIGLPAVTSRLSGSFSANAGNLRICTPPGVPLRIQMGDEPLGSNNFAQRGLVRDGNTWTRGIIGVGNGMIDLTVSASLGTITLDPEDGCG